METGEGSSSWIPCRGLTPLRYRHDATPELWQETYMSAVLRAICYSDDASYRLAGYRKLDPISTPEAELRFLQAAEALFLRGSSGLVEN